jgi:tRNA nucleotidyltransferase (CCA-adding enzyme)
MTEYSNHKEFIRKVNEIVTPAYLVGGAVRDIVLGRTPNDFDFATPLSPDEIEDAIHAAGKRAYGVGKRFGTVGFKLDGEMIEVTTFRTEKYSHGSRKPQVEFVRDITHDLSRRDFTINAMAIKMDGKIISPFGGRDDLYGADYGRKTLLRAVGNPTIRFKEDPLRILRLARFSSQFNSEVEENTLKSATRLSSRILSVSVERWMLELDKLLSGEFVANGFRVLRDTGVLSFILPELVIQFDYDQHSPYHEFDLWTHTMKTVEAIPRANIDLRWSALLHDVGKPFSKSVKNKTFERNGEDVTQWNYINHHVIGSEIIKGIASRLKWSNSRRDFVTSIVLNHLEEDSPLAEADSGGQKGAS